MTRSVLTRRFSCRPMWAGGAIATSVAVGIVVGLAVSQRTAAAQTARSFDADADVGIIVNYISATGATDFEGVVRKLGDALAASEDAGRREQLAGWRIYKAKEPGPSDSVVYMSFIDPVVAEADYAVTDILNEEFPEQVQGLYETFMGAFAPGLGQIVINLERLEGFPPDL